MWWIGGFFRKIPYAQVCVRELSEKRVASTTSTTRGNFGPPPPGRALFAALPLTPSAMSFP
jgi:hypothetical protein